MSLGFIRLPGFQGTNKVKDPAAGLMVGLLPVLLPTPAHLSSLILIIPNQKQLKGPSAVEWIYNLWYIRTMQ